MTTESKMQSLMPLLDDWMITKMKIKMLLENRDYSKVIMAELVKLEYLQQSDLTSEWLKIDKESVMSVTSLQPKN